MDRSSTTNRYRFVVKYGYILLAIMLGSRAVAATMPSGFNYPTSATWTDNWNWLAAGGGDTPSCDDVLNEYLCGKYHLGKDIGAAAGADVYAVGPGRIVHDGTGTSDVEQKFMWVEFDLSSGGHFYVVYGHVNRTKPGNDVAKGDVIATIASWPGNNHLHFGIRPDGYITSGWGRGSIPAGWNGNKNDLNKNGFVGPWDYLSTHQPAGTGCIPNASDIWLDFGWGGPYTGCQQSPFSSLTTAIDALNSGGILHIRPGSTSWTGTISKPMTLQAESGTVTIGN